MTELQSRLFGMRDAVYADRQSKLLSELPRGRIIGVRVKYLRDIAREMERSPYCREFLDALPHEFYDEDVLHAIIIERKQGIDNIVPELEAFLPHVTEWFVCDMMSVRILKAEKPAFLEKIREWTASGEKYFVRFGVRMLMEHYLDSGFLTEYLDIPAGIVSDEYEVNEMRAWFYTAALIKRWGYTKRIFEAACLDMWTHNTAIQKALESKLLPDEKKDYLRGLIR